MELKKVNLLEAIKSKLEDMRKIHSMVMKPYWDKYNSIKAKTISSVVDSFKEYFQNAGFQISEEKELCRACYNTLEIVFIKTPNENEFGAYLTFKIEFGGNSYTILVKEECQNRNIRVITKRHSSKDKIQDEINNLEKEIDELTTKLEQVENIIKELDLIELYFEIIDKNNKNLHPNIKLKTFDEVLTKFFG